MEAYLIVIYHALDRAVAARNLQYDGSDCVCHRFALFSAFNCACWLARLPSSSFTFFCRSASLHTHTHKVTREECGESEMREECGESEMREECGESEIREECASDK